MEYPRVHLLGDGNRGFSTWSIDKLHSSRGGRDRNSATSVLA